MHLEGSYTFNAPRTTVWKLLLDHEILAKVTPGVKSLEPQGNDEYKAIFEVKMGPVNGSFSGRMAVADKQEPERFTLKMQMNGRIGNVSAEGALNLIELGPEQTEVRFAGDAKLTGTLARTGQRVLSGVARTMTNQFFKSIEKELETLRGAPAPAKVSLWQRLKRWLRRVFGRKSG